MMLEVLFLVVALAASSYGREYGCTVDEALCTGSGTQSITMNGVTKCCPPQASMNINSNNCLCVENPAASHELTCLQGSQQCSGASSFTTDSVGNLRCCPPGPFHMSSFMKTDSQGQVTESCTCKQQGSGFGNIQSSLSSFLGHRGSGGGGGSMIMSALTGGLPSGSAGTGNYTGGGALDQWRQMGQNWKNWGQEFTKGFQTWGRNFGQSMQGTGRDLARDLSGVLRATMTRTALPIQRALNDMIGNVFTSVPGK